MATTRNPPLLSGLARVHVSSLSQLLCVRFLPRGQPQVLRHHLQQLRAPRLRHSDLVGVKQAGQGEAGLNAVQPS